MTHVVQFSTGVGSAEVAYRVVERYGRENTFLLTADTLKEDEDNWRYASEVFEDLGCRWRVLTDGRTPMQVGRDHRVVPNNRMAVCSRILKRELLRSYLEEHFSPERDVVHLGFDWTEPNRFRDAKVLETCPKCRERRRPCADHVAKRCEWCDFYEVEVDPSEAHVHPWQPWQIAAPLMDPPYMQKADLFAVMRGRGIEPPRLYLTGAPHANCGGACVRGGQVEWRRLLYWNRDRYLEWEGEEEETRTMLGKNVTILRDRTGGSLTPLSLRNFRLRLEEAPNLFDNQDYGSCGCMEGP